MARQKQKKKRDKQCSLTSPAAGVPPAPQGPLTEAWRGRMMQSAVRRGERQPGRSS
jgi:hypothetical protein